MASTWKYGVTRKCRDRAARVATEIARALDRRGLPVRMAAKDAGATAADLSRIRNADLDRFTLDRLVRIAERLGCRVEIKVGKAA